MDVKTYREKINGTWATLQAYLYLDMISMSLDVVVSSSSPLVWPLVWSDPIFTKSDRLLTITFIQYYRKLNTCLEINNSRYLSDDIGEFSRGISCLSGSGVSPLSAIASASMCLTYELVVNCCCPCCCSCFVIIVVTVVVVVEAFSSLPLSTSVSSQLESVSIRYWSLPPLLSDILGGSIVAGLSRGSYGLSRLFDSSLLCLRIGCLVIASMGKWRLACEFFKLSWKMLF